MLTNLVKMLCFIFCPINLLCLLEKFRHAMEDGPNSSSSTVYYFCSYAALSPMYDLE